MKNRFILFAFALFLALAVLSGGISPAGVYAGESKDGAKSENADVIYVSDLDGIKHDLIKDPGITTNGVNIGLFGATDKIVINGVMYKKGFMTHPIAADTPSEITVNIASYSTEYPVFHVIVGKDDFTEPGGTGLPIAFKIIADGREVYSSQPLDYGDENEVYVNVAGAEVLTLRCYAAGTFAWLTTNFADPYLCKLDVKEVRMASAPKKVCYVAGERMSLAGGTLEVEYANGSAETVEITEDMLSGYDLAVEGDQTVTVTYKGHTFTYDITVIDVPSYSPDPDNSSSGRGGSANSSESAEAKDKKIRALTTALIVTSALLGVLVIGIICLVVFTATSKKRRQKQYGQDTSGEGRS